MITLYTQLMLERGFLASGRFYASYAHKKEHIQAFQEAVGQVFSAIAQARSENKIKNLLNGPVAHSGFMRLT